MLTATASPFINSRKTDNKYEVFSVSIRVTYDRVRRYYPIGMRLSKSDFEKIMNAKRRTDEEKELYNKIRTAEKRAIEAIDALPVFTWSKFEEIYLSNREAVDSIKAGFDKYIKILESEDRIGTAVAYQTAINSLEEFRTGMKYADITKQTLNAYEKWMLDQGKSITTVGIYLRSLRTIFNLAAIDKALYPFGQGKGRYQIPTGRNEKKALTRQEVGRIFNYSAASAMESMARDYWIFIYLCNGLNMKDMLLLQWKDIDGEVLRFTREKTKRSKNGAEKIVVSIKPEAKSIIEKYGVPSVSPNNFIFPHLHKAMTVKRQREVTQQVVKNVNTYMKAIAKVLGITKPITTYAARHSFATILKNSGASVEFISEALGHSSVQTTKSYLDSFDLETVHKTTDALTSFA